MVRAKYRFFNLMLRLMDQPSLVFLILALIFGGLFIFKLPPLSGTDEFTHFPRAYQISMGTFWEQPIGNHEYGGRLPVNVNNMINDYRNLSRFPTGQTYLNGAAALNAKYSRLSNPGKQTVVANFTSTLMYPPWAYVPSEIGLLLAKALKLPLVWYVYLSRISTYLVWVVMAFLAIRFLPAGKWFMTALALLPTSISQAATIGGDGIQMGLAWLLIAITLGLVVRKLKPSLPLLVSTTIIAVYAAVIKDGYFLLGLVPLIVPLKLFAKKTIGIVWKAVTLVLVALSAALFTIRTVHAVHGTVLTPTIGMNLNSSAQIHYMLSHVITYGLHIIEEPFTKVFDTTYLGIVAILTNRLIYLSILVIGLLFFGLYLGFRQTPKLEKLNPYKARLMVYFSAIFVLTYGLLASAFYIGNTSVGATFVNGFYGRYFLPLLPLLLIYPMTLKSRQTTSGFSLQIGITAIAIIGLIAMVLSIQ